MSLFWRPSVGMVLVLAAVTVWVHGNAVRASEEWELRRVSQSPAEAQTSIGVLTIQLPARQAPRGREDGSSAAALGQALAWVPEPGAVLLLVAGGLGLFSHRRRRMS